MKPLLPSTSSTSKDKKSANPRNAMKRYLDHIDSATDNLSANGNKIDKRVCAAHTKRSKGRIEANTTYLVQGIYGRPKANLCWKCQTTVLDAETEIPRSGGKEISGIREAIQTCLW